MTNWCVINRFSNCICVCVCYCHLLSETDETTEQQLLAAAAGRMSTWVSLETSRESRHWLPWRPNYDVGESSVEDCEDPDRVIILDDLSGALFNVDSLQDRFYLICRFIDFIGKCLPFSGFGQPGFCLTEEGSTDSSLWWKVSEAFLDTDSLSAFDEVRLAQSELDKLCLFVENVYTKTVGLFEGDMRTELTLRYMHFKTAVLLSQNHSSDRRKRKHAEKEVRQFFKSLLKQEHNRSNLAVWERYACFEWEIGNFDDARRVFETALAMAGPAVDRASENCKFPVVRLYSTYSCLELGVSMLNTRSICSACTKQTVSDVDNKRKRALRILAMAVNGYRANSAAKDTTSTEIVRARHFYQRHLDDAHAAFSAVVSSDTEQLKCRGRSLLEWMTCFALFQLVTIGLPSASSVMHSFQTNIRKLSDISVAAVDVNLDQHKIAADNLSKLYDSSISIYHALLQSAARLHIELAQFYLTSGAAPLNVVRTALFNALAEFPNDVRFLKNFVEIELSSHISGRLREYFHGAVNRADTPLPVLYAVLAERKRLLRLSADGQMPCESSVIFGPIVVVVVVVDIDVQAACDSGGVQ